jgi:GNAT superfamily N-acetyltransferase
MSIRRGWPLPPGGLPDGVVTADPADTDALSQVIAEAFFDLAPSRWLLADPDVRREVFPGYFRIYVEHAMARGVVHTTPGRTAAALWLPAGVHPPAPDPDYGIRLTAATSPWTDRFRLFDKALERHHPAGVAHHHLAILAVHPESQGQGTGTALLHAHHATLDAAGMPAYLEASDPRTRRLYLTCGYKDHGLPIHLAGGPLLYPMWRSSHEPQ